MLEEWRPQYNDESRLDMTTKTRKTRDIGEERWFMLQNRARAADAPFIYAVRTTGVYCRPGCASRLPNRRNVAFFDDAVQAKAAGYRACKRCRPDESEPADARVAAVREACRLLDAGGEAVPLHELAAAVKLSPAHFHRMFKRVTGVTPRAYAAMRRVRHAKTQLRSGASVTSAIYASGYAAPSRFYDDAAKMLGMTPTEYRNGAAGQAIQVAVTKASLGMVLIAATSKGVCAVEMGDDERQLFDLARRHFPQATFVEADERFQLWIAEIVALLDTPARGLTLPLDIQGTAFQRRVWDALRTVPAGATTTYAQLAAAIGQPQAVRAVARACAANKLAVAIPCHRVVRSDGNISGYRWGVERKQALLKQESEVAR